MSVNLWLIRPVRSSIGLAVILLGIPFFYCLRKPAVDSPRGPRPLVLWTRSSRNQNILAFNHFREPCNHPN
jgi:hypothetical protein